ncbi:MAG: VOC family protein [Candidatus Dormibacteria bacterium]
MAISARSARLDHVGIAVHDLGAAAQALAGRLGVAAPPPERVEPDGIEAVFLDLGGPALELLGSTRPDSRIARFLERRGEGVHHLAYGVDDIASELRRWSEQGAELIDQAPRPGSRGRLVAFLHPATELGVLTELVQLPKDWGASRVERHASPPTVVCLCGSARFHEAFQQADHLETAAGRIVLAAGPHPDGAGDLDALTQGKIDLADEILVLNVGGRTDDATTMQIAHARARGKRVRWLEPPPGSPG